MRLCLSLFVITTALTSCGGYSIVEPRSTLSSKPWGKAAICIADIEEDLDGELSAALTYAFTSRHFLITHPQEADYILEVKPTKETDRNVGFTYAPNKPGSTVKRRFLVANEGRLSMGALVTLKEKDSGTVIFSKKIMEQNVSFDFQADVGVDNVHSFSLGQFEMHEEAKSSAKRNLSYILAKAIVEQIYYDLI